MCSYLTTLYDIGTFHYKVKYKTLVTANETCSYKTFKGQLESNSVIDIIYLDFKYLAIQMRFKFVQKVCCEKLYNTRFCGQLNFIKI